MLRAAGKQIGELELPDGCLVVSVLRNGTGFVPKADTVIEAGDEVLAVLEPGRRARGMRAVRRLPRRRRQPLAH